MIEDILLYAVVGFAAQMVDGAIGMAYGLTATSVLLSAGVTPAMASASVHAAEVVTTGASGFAHWRLGNVRLATMARLAVPGAVGGLIGALALVSMPVDIIKPLVSVYLLVLGLVILRKAMRPTTPPTDSKQGVVGLGLCGGFLDAIGGGGWGPIVSSTLIGRGDVPRTVIGSVNAAEFFVTATITAAFATAIGLELWPIILGLIIGGVIAAPFAALVTKKLPDRPLMLIVAGVITLLALRNLIASLRPLFGA